MRPARSRVLSLLVAIGFVVLATAGLRISERGQDFEVVWAGLDDTVEVEHGELTVSRLRVGTAVNSYGSVGDTTTGLFVVVRVSGAATGSTDLRLTGARLLAADGLVYSPYGNSSSLVVPTGFREDVDQVFEVDPARIDDLTLEVWRSELVAGFEERVQVELGITGENAASWRAQGADQVLAVARPTRQALP